MGLRSFGIWQFVCFMALGATQVMAFPLSGQLSRQSPEATGCQYRAISRDGLSVRPGYLDFMKPSELQPLKAALPRVDDTELNAVLTSADTIWYDEASMVFMYQDSIEVVVGGRANCVGRLVGEQNRNNPGIAKLLNYFGPDYRFKFPFRTAAGTDNVTNVKVINFWVPPRQNGQVLPVKWWRDSSRGRWRWVFPSGTLFGEVLYEKSPEGNWQVFEIRTRRRYLDGWVPQVFRPFVNANAMADAVMTHRPAWRDDAELRRLVEHLQDPATLTPYRLVSPAYGRLFPAVDGALDTLPPVTDSALITELLTQTVFKASEGEIWKEHGALQTFAAASQSEYSIVPRGYEMGMIAVNEVSCNRCHSETSARLGKMEIDIILYGEIWGEDRIFTWHLFQPHELIFNTFDDADGSRRVNPWLQQAGLLRNERPAAGDPLYKALPAAYDRTN